MVMGSGTHIERLTKRCLPPATGDVLIEQHQQACFLEGSREHELDVGGADITGNRWFDPLTSVSVPTEVGSHMKKKRP